MINEKSPYLLQHAHNPVDWWPWCDDVFAKAKAEDKPVFLSIGYSTCHWCHVMERESFEDPQVAALLNQHFISVKVDREENPDIDHAMMDACVAMNGSGGWPLSAFLDEEGRPFYMGTYYPKQTQGRTVGFIPLLERIAALWANERPSLRALRDRLEHMLEDESIPSDWPEDMPHRYARQLTAVFDGRYGGFSGAPKFPTPHHVLFLLRYAKIYRQKEALAMAEKTLDAMGEGGLFDHVGYGFARYSTDERWLVPHFEKMLYDNALLLMTYAEAYHATEKTRYRRIAEQTAAYILREMTSPEGGFYTAQDADSEGVEGKYYVWTPEEIVHVLGTDAPLYCLLYGVTKQGNFEGKNIPNLIGRPLPDEQLAFSARCADALYRARQARVPPFKDDKILASWNGLMIAALASAGRIFQKREYIEAAERCVQFLNTYMGLQVNFLSVCRDGQSKKPAHAEDYAFVLWGLIELYRAEPKPEYIPLMRKLADALISGFWDDEHGGLVLTANSTTRRVKPTEDGAMPSVNSAAAHCLYWLALICDEPGYRVKADAILRYCAGKAGRSPIGHGFSVIASMLRDHYQSLVISAGERENDDELMKIAQAYHPFLLTIRAGSNDPNYPPLGGMPTAYLCRKNVCLPPITDAAELRSALNL